jgi:hypothetical protein
MFAWILILGSWIAFLSLILHDATNEDSGGSIVCIAARNFKMVISLAMRKARTLRATPGHDAISQAIASTPRARQPRAPLMTRWWAKDHRISMTAAELELAILEAVQKAAPGCEDFVAVIVQYEKPKSHLDPNWSIRGVKFGKANRKMVDEALKTVLERMRREFRLNDR